MLEAKENPFEFDGLGAVEEGVEPNENWGLGAFVADFEFETNAMLANGFGLDGGSFPTTFMEVGDTDVDFGCARFVEAKGLEEAAGLGADALDPPPPPPPNFRLTLKIFLCFITSSLARLIP